MNYYSQAIQIFNEVKKQVVGKDEALKLVLSAMIAGGHVLIDDIPGVGKTTMATAFAKASGLKFNRMQFTPDVLPSDISGFTMPNPEKKGMIFQRGAIFCNLFLADEINRTSPKTQSALLEVMEEYQVTVDGRTFPLERPFIVLATENPTGSSGTMKLPESEMDRFMIGISLGYPSEKEEVEILKRKEFPEEVQKVCDPENLLAMQKEQNSIYIHDAVYDYIVRLVKATREQKYLELGASPRASLSLSAMGRAYAYIAGRDYVLPEDIAKVYLPVVSHRVIESREARIDGVSSESVLMEILKNTPRPAERKTR